MAFKYSMVIRRVDYGADTLSELSAIYCRARDATEEGCSTFRPVNVREGEKIIGHISYNGRIWNKSVNVGLSMPACLDDSSLIYDNRLA